MMPTGTYCTSDDQCASNQRCEDFFWIPEFWQWPSRKNLRLPEYQIYLSTLENAYQMGHTAKTRLIVERVRNIPRQDGLNTVCADLIWILLASTAPVLLIAHGIGWRLAVILANASNSNYIPA